MFPSFTVQIKEEKCGRYLHQTDTRFFIRRLVRVFLKKQKKTKNQRSVFFNNARERLWMKLRCWLFPSLRRCQVGVPTCSTHDQLAPFFLIRPLVRLTPPFVLPFSFSPGPTSSGLFSPSITRSFFFFFLPLVCLRPRFPFFPPLTHPTTSFSTASLFDSFASF